jgi:hypothetical protein
LIDLLSKEKTKKSICPETIRNPNLLKEPSDNLNVFDSSVIQRKNQTIIQLSKSRQIQILLNKQSLKTKPSNAGKPADFQVLFKRP